MSIERGLFGELESERRELKARKEAAFMRRVRLAKRDQDYARSPYAAPVTVETRGGRVIETRGQCGIAPRITHLGGNF